ncbi:MAG: DNA methyltransferase, partial [Ignavibacteriae bacterium]|nr:DNA methyltransferase [Ignavibacteriota bacterium]
EEYHPDTGTLFASWLSDEAREANHVKRETPVMCVIGNPPYAVSSSNKSDWIINLLDDYKKDLNEKSYNSLSDDYVKFIRFGEYYIQKNGEGILAYISNNSFLDGLTHRKMRKQLLETFDDIFIIDLHGNSKKKEKSPDGSIDENVFDIMQGVSINIFIKSRGKNINLAKIHHADIYGKRIEKYKILNNNTIASINWDSLINVDPNYFFVPKDFESEKSYKNGFLITDLMRNFNPGVESGRDSLFIDFEKSDLEKRIKNVFQNKDSTEINQQYKIKDTGSYKLKSNLLSAEFDKNKFVEINYRPFDSRFTYYDCSLQRRASYDTFKHILNGALGLVIKRGFNEVHSAPCYLVDTLSDRRGWTRAGMQGAESIAPLYYYPESSNNDFDIPRIPNLNPEIVKTITSKINLEFLPEEPQPGNLCMAQNP